MALCEVGGQGPQRDARRPASGGRGERDTSGGGDGGTHHGGCENGAFGCVGLVQGERVDGFKAP